MGLGAINVLMTVVSLVLVERAGRKTLLLAGFGGMAVDTLILTIAMVFSVSDYCKYIYFLLSIVFLEK